jgi:hypothetical protein
LCQRCGLRQLLNDLVFDGQIPWLRVCSECRDPKHPQEIPVSVADPQALRRPSPELGGPTTPTLTGMMAGTDAGLSWTQSTVGDSIIEWYLLYRAFNAGPDVLRDSLRVERDYIGTILVNPLTFTDTSLPAGVYDYFVIVRDAHGRTARSNIITLESE